MGQVYCTHVFLFSGGIWYMLYEKESESYTCKISTSIATELEAFRKRILLGMLRPSDRSRQLDASFCQVP